MRLILTFLLTISFSFVFAQPAVNDTSTTKEVILKTFIHKLADENVAVDIIISQYVIVEEPTDELYDYLEVSLEEIRINLLSKNIEEIKYIPYQQMSKKDIKDIDIENLDSNNIYFLYYKNKQMLALYIEQDKIGSFTLVANGNGKAHFVLY